MITWLLLIFAFFIVIDWIIVRNEKTKLDVANVGLPIPGNFSFYSASHKHWVYFCCIYVCFKHAGLVGWRVLLHLPNLMKHANIFPVMNEYAKTFGSIFRLRFGGYNAIILNDYHQIKRAFSSSDFAGRPGIYFFDVISRGFQGVIFSSGSLWKEHRQFTMRQLLELGASKSRMEFRIQQEMLAFNQELNRQSANGNPVDMGVLIHFATASITWNIFTGISFPYNIVPIKERIIIAKS